MVPTVIATPGTWCLRKDLSTSDPDFRAIDIQTNNVTINCNSFRLQNLATGTGPYSSGVAVGGGSSNVTVRNCTIDGFGYGIWITGSPPGTGYVIESNRFSQSRFVGIRMDGFGSVIRNNILTNTGGASGTTVASGIQAFGRIDVLDNVVDGVFGEGYQGSFKAIGITAGDANQLNTPEGTFVGFEVRGNRVRNLLQKNDVSEGIVVSGTGILVSDNPIGQPTPTVGWGVVCFGDARARDNVVKNYGIGVGGACTDDGGNVAY